MKIMKTLKKRLSQGHNLALEDFEPRTSLFRILHATIYNVYLGWLYHTIDSLGDKPSREQKAVHHLQKSIDVDNTNGQTWYLLGR